MNLEQIFFLRNYYEVCTDPMFILSCVWSVTIDGVWIGNQIYCTFIHTTHNYK
jgi:hypothetical protein